MFVKWLQYRVVANTWISEQRQRGFGISNLDRFRQCEAECLAIVKSLQQEGDDELPEAMKRLRDEALMEHRNGETAEFV